MEPCSTVARRLAARGFLFACTYSIHISNYIYYADYLQCKPRFVQTCHTRVPAPVRGVHRYTLLPLLLTTVTDGCNYYIYGGGSVFSHTGDKQVTRSAPLSLIVFGGLAHRFSVCLLAFLHRTRPSHGKARRTRWSFALRGSSTKIVSDLRQASTLYRQLSLRLSLRRLARCTSFQLLCPAIVFLLFSRFFSTL